MYTGCQQLEHSTQLLTLDHILFLTVVTLTFLIAVRVRVFILQKNVSMYGLIRVCTLIYFGTKNAPCTIIQP